MNIRLSIILILVLNFSAFAQPKLKADEIVQKHLASIGAADALANVKSIIVVGNGKAEFRGLSTPGLNGVAQIGSENDKVLLALIFREVNYPYEKAGYDGRDFTISRLPDGRRTALGDFFVSNSLIFKEGLIGGVLSAAWSLRNLDLRRAKVESAGIEKIKNRPVYKVKYSPRRVGEGMNISFFFDATTFQHLRTEYQVTRSAQLGKSSTQDISRSDTFQKLTEDFSDFKTEGKLMMPHTYKLTYSAVSTITSSWQEYTVNFSTFVYDQPIDISAYNVAVK